MGAVTPHDTRMLGGPGVTPAGPRATRWQAEFPYHWDADEYVSRRELLRLAVAASGALFASTAGIAILGQFQAVRHAGELAVARVSEIAPGGVKYFTYTPSGEQALLLHLANGHFVAYSARCTHLSCAVYYDKPRDRLFCPCHEGVFDPSTGDPVAGPPQRPLPRIALRQEGDTLLATEEAPQ